MLILSATDAIKDISELIWMIPSILSSPDAIQSFTCQICSLIAISLIVPIISSVSSAMLGTFWPVESVRDALILRTVLFAIVLTQVSVMFVNLAKTVGHQKEV